MMRKSKQSARSSASFLSLASVLLGILTVFSACQDGSPTSQGKLAILPVSFSIEPTLSSNETEAIENAFDRVNGFEVIVKAHPSLRLVLDTIIGVTPGQNSYDLNIPVELEGDEATFDVTVIALDGLTPLFTAHAIVQLSANDPTGGSAGGQSFTLPIRYVGPGIRGIVQDGEGSPVPGIVVDLRQGGVTVASATTDPDGVALFYDLPTGTYTMVPRSEAGAFFCPSARQVRLADSDAKAESLFRRSPLACEIRVLVLSGGDFDHNAGVLTSLQSLIPEADFDSFFFINNPPDLSYLTGFNVVLLFEDGVFGGSQILGDRVAEYMAQGGNLVVGTFYWQNRSDGPFDTRGWGALEGWDVFSSAGGATYTSGSMDPNSVVSHPVMSGISSIESSGFRGGVSGGGDGVLARWNDGTPLIGVAGGTTGTRIAAISFFIGDGGGDGLALYSNAVQWAGSGGLASNASGSSQATEGVDWKAPSPFNYRSDDPGDTPSRKLGGTHHKH